MSLIKNSFIIFVVLCFVKYLACKEGVSYKYQRNACNQFNPKFISSTSCRIRHFNRTTQLLNSETNIKPNVSLDNIRLEMITYFKFGTVYRPSLVHLSEFICEALNFGKYSHYLNALKSSYAKYSNLLEPCPKSGKLYVKNMLMDLTNFPQFVPIGEYRIDVKFLTYMNGYEEFIMLHQDFIEVKPLGALQF